MAAPTNTFIDPGAGSDHEGASFVDGVWDNATLTLTKTGAFTAAVAGDKFELSDNSSGEVIVAIYEIASKTDNNNVVLTTDIRSGAPDPTDVVLNQGTGVIGIPYATTQHALDFTTRDATDGDQFNIKSGTDDVLGVNPLTLTTYGTPTATAPLVFRGYNTAADDIVYGVQTALGGIDGDGSPVIAEFSKDFIHFIDLHLHNAGSSTIINLDNDSSVVNCEVNNTSGTAIAGDLDTCVKGCNIHDIGGTGVDADNGEVIDNYFKNGTKKFTTAVNNTSANVLAVHRNIFTFGSASTSIAIKANDGASVIANSILSPLGTTNGIVQAGTVNQLCSVASNAVDGYDGALGEAITLASGARMWFYDFNAVNAPTVTLGTSIAGDVRVGETDNEATAASLFAESGADTFANRFVFFAPVDTGNMRGGGYPNGSGNIDKGAVQSTAAAGAGGGLKLVGAGGLVG